MPYLAIKLLQNSVFNFIYSARITEQTMKEIFILPIAYLQNIHKLTISTSFLF